MIGRLRVSSFTSSTRKFSLSENNGGRFRCTSSVYITAIRFEEERMSAARLKNCFYEIWVTKLKFTRNTTNGWQLWAKCA
jgi:hypothetical protein